eukprot:TRINITY_DN94520_c0_g1_i1.p1 TRINITY_DN94520_c0_g1~~TRINITY_DN94520_c0_g1_i1.p1  ORF type:complete len:217 (+),score=56.67 TRINITY_DN94520_c0_g1_i1:75-725(+)
MNKTPAPESEQLFVRGLPMDMTTENATAIFSQYGTVSSCKVLPVAQGKTAAAAYLVMATVDEARWVVQNINNNVPQGLAAPIEVEFAMPREQRAGGFDKGGKGGMKGMMSMFGMMDAMMGGPYGGWGGWGGFGKGKGMGGKGKGGGGGGGPAAWSGIKTRMCWHMESTGTCQKGSACTFAHSPEEIAAGKQQSKAAGKGSMQAGGGMQALGGMMGF